MVSWGVLGGAWRPLHHNAERSRAPMPPPLCITKLHRANSYPGNDHLPTARSYKNAYSSTKIRLTFPIYSLGPAAQLRIRRVILVGRQQVPIQPSTIRWGIKPRTRMIRSCSRTLGLRLLIISGTLFLFNSEGRSFLGDFYPFSQWEKNSHQLIEQIIRLSESLRWRRALILGILLKVSGGEGTSTV